MGEKALGVENFRGSFEIFRETFENFRGSFVGKSVGVFEFFVGVFVRGSMEPVPVSPEIYENALINGRKNR